jgi:hypothetical protein
VDGEGVTSSGITGARCGCGSGKCCRGRVRF